jgi:hypothetical protein
MNSNWNNNQKLENLEDENDYDELNEIKDLINKIIDDFSLSFFSERVVFYENNKIFRRYLNNLKKELILRTDFDGEGFNLKIANFYFEDNFIDYFIIENLTNKLETTRKSFDENYEEKKEMIKKLELNKNLIYNDYSALLLLEFISTEVELDNSAYNFYYKDVLNDISKLNFYKFIDNIEDENIQPVCESCEYEAVKKFIFYVSENIIFKWNFYEKKRIFNEYYFSE